EGLKLKDIAEGKEEFLRVGKEAVRSGKVAAVLLAGGMGTRLGSDAPKGVYDIGITKPLYIFEQLIRNLQDVCGDCGGVVPLYIMTSETNDVATRKFLKEHDFFGYPESAVRFFLQDMAACVDFEGNLLLEARDRLALSPNGNGGWYTSLFRAGLIDEAKAQGVEWFNVFAVDNVLQRIADPAFVGATVLSGRKSGAKVVCKANPYEKVGVLCLEDGSPSVIEYYELTGEMANMRDQSGDLVYSYGVILNYLFRLDRLEEIAREKIPTHVVKKKIPYLDETGNLVKPETENGYKFEMLILDMARLMASCRPY
ncbi:MAG: UTP--glucose-1-phosphate uridylyltransferase, partial [Clostridiales bacterium]|nr:UTP--glucose-1-phosphate uridylyltransferase [Clostridiales bacterium]